MESQDMKIAMKNKIIHKIAFSAESGTGKPLLRQSLFFEVLVIPSASVAWCRGSLVG